MAHANPRPNVETLRDQPVSTRAAGELGWTRSAARHAVDRGELVRPRRGVLLAAPAAASDSPAWTARERAVVVAAQAAALTCPRAAISHTPAALAYEIPIVHAALRACLTVPAGTALRRLVDVHLHRATLPDEDVVDVGGFRTLAPARTVLDMAREHGVAAGVVAADHALRTELLSVDDLAAAYERCVRWPGRKRARAVLLLTDGTAESPLESLSRLEMAACRLPPPRPQVRIADRFGRFIARCDFYWDEFGVVGEADGEGKYRDGDETPVARRRRQGLLTDTGLLVERWGWAEARAFEPTATRLRRAFANGAGRAAPGREWIVLPDDRRRPDLEPLIRRAR